jgi:hypothetical protein
VIYLPNENISAKMIAVMEGALPKKGIKRQPSKAASDGRRRKFFR